MSILFTNVTAVTMSPAAPLLKDAFVAVEGTQITYAGATRPAGDFSREIDCTGKVMMPGLINAHTHIPMTILRGYGGGCNLQTWLNDYIFPAEARLDDRAVSIGTRLGLAEMIANGVTCIADMYMRTGVIAREIVSAGISANLSCGGLYFGDPADFSEDNCSDCKNQKILTQEWHGHNDGQILVDASIHAEYTSTAPLWQWMADYALKHGLGMHVHVSETVSEHEQSKQRNGGLTPIQALDKYGVWENGAIAAHCVWVSGQDMEIMAKKHITAVHNPVSNLKLASGVARVGLMQEKGVNVALGTDGVASNNNHDLFEEIKLASLLQKGVNLDPVAVPARKALEMATVNAARALGRNTGVIGAGRTADLILLNFEDVNLFPCHDVEENLAYSARGSNVCMNMARGKIIYENGVFHTLDVERIREEMTSYAIPKIFH